MAKTLHSQISTEIKKQGYKPRVGISISSMNQNISATETFQTDSTTYTGVVSGSPTLRVAVEPMGGFTKVTSFQVSFLNQELFSNLFATYPTPENAEVVVKLYFDDGSAILEAESLQLFVGRIKDFPAITHSRVAFNVETQNLLVDKMIGNIVQDSDSSTMKVADDQVGKVKPIAYGNHTGMRFFGDTILSNVHFNQKHSLWPCLWFNQEGENGKNHWIVADHTIASPNLPSNVGTHNFWAYDDDLGRFVQVIDSHISAVTAPQGKSHVGVAVDNEVYYYDYVLPTAVTDTSQDADGTATTTDDENIIDFDKDTKAVLSIEHSQGEQSNNANDIVRAGLTAHFSQAYPIADDDIAEVKSYAILKQTESGYVSQVMVGASNISLTLNTKELVAGQTYSATTAGVQSNCEVEIHAPPTGGGSDDSSMEGYMVWKRVKYKKTHNVGKDASGNAIIQPKRLPIFCAGEGIEYGSWVNGSRSNGTTGLAITNASGSIESLLRDQLGLADANIRESDFDTTYSNLSSTKMAFFIDKQVKGRDIIDKIAKTTKSVVFYDTDNKVSMRTFPASSSAFSASGNSSTAQNDDIFSFTPSVSSGSFTNHPIIRNSFSLAKMQTNLATTVEVHYAKFHTKEYGHSTSATNTSYITDDYKDTLNHDFTADSTTAQLWRDFTLERRARKYWKCKFKTFMNAVGVEIYDVINVRHPVLDGIFGTSDMNAKKWVVFSVNQVLGAFEIEIECVELTTT